MPYKDSSIFKNVLDSRALGFSLYRVFVENCPGRAGIAFREVIWILGMGKLHGYGGNKVLDDIQIPKISLKVLSSGDSSLKLFSYRSKCNISPPSPLSSLIQVASITRAESPKEYTFPLSPASPSFIPQKISTPKKRKTISSAS